MNETPTYSQFNFADDDDLSCPMFGVPTTTTHAEFHDDLQPGPYTGTFTLHASASASDHLSSQNFPFGCIPRSLVASYNEHTCSSTPFSAHAKFESPALSNGSSSTPETNESQQLVTPRNAPGNGHVPDDGGKSEEDSDDDPLPLTRSTHKHLRKYNARDRNTTDPTGREGNRTHFLQRNRVAAMKCRKKKKEWVNDLEETKSGLESQNTHLHMELDGLVGEAGRIRSQLMSHANCNDSNIDKWIENEAKRFVIGTGERYDQILAHFSPTQLINNPQEGMSSSSAAAAAVASEYTVGGPSLISPLETPSQLSPTSHAGQVPASPFYTPNASSLNTPVCFVIPPQEAAQFARGLEQTRAAAAEPDYDGMPISLYGDSVD
ncbi:hypothetical protein F4802DRAFT_295891 [Xylaria palmicola]|nr:hypothetical protein F4802DRAFT_295891 [Xylaria palmicola]